MTIKFLPVVRSAWKVLFNHGFHGGHGSGTDLFRLTNKFSINQNVGGLEDLSVIFPCLSVFPVVKWIFKILPAHIHNL